MTKREELLALGKQSGEEERAYIEEYCKEHGPLRGYGAGELPGILEIRKKYKKKYFEIQEKYKNMDKDEDIAKNDSE
ncbi:MAG: hypothetical protein ACI4KO_07185 [Ruminiclostridium sp.]